MIRRSPAVLGAVLVVSSACTASAPPTRFLQPTQAVTASAEPAPGELTNFGFAISPQNTSSVELRSARVLGVTSGMEIVRTSWVRPKRGHQVGVLYGDLETDYPGRYEIVPVAGAVLTAAASEHWVLVITVRAKSPGRYSTTSVRLSFVAETRTVSETLPISVSIDVQPGATPHPPLDTGPRKAAGTNTPPS